MKKFILSMSAIALMMSSAACGNKSAENEEATEEVEVIEVVNDSTAVDSVVTPTDTLPTEDVAE